MIDVKKAAITNAGTWNFDLGRSTAEGALTSRSLLERDSAIRWGGLLCLAMHKPRTVFNAASEMVPLLGFCTPRPMPSVERQGKKPSGAQPPPEIRRKLVERCFPKESGHLGTGSTSQSGHRTLKVDIWVPLREQCGHPRREKSLFEPFKMSTLARLGVGKCPLSARQSSLV